MKDCAEYAMFSAERDGSSVRARARASWPERRLDALLMTGEENFQYFAGGSASLALHYSLSRPNCLILPLQGDPVIITQTKDYMTLATYITEFREYFDVLQVPARAGRRHAPASSGFRTAVSAWSSGRSSAWAFRSVRTWRSSPRCRGRSSSTPPMS